jgi:DNA repair protein RadC
MAVRQPLYCKLPQERGPRPCGTNLIYAREDGAADRPRALSATVWNMPRPAALRGRARLRVVPARRPIADWPEAQRPREKLLRDGALQLNDSELLAVLLGSGPHGQSAVDLGGALLARYGSLHHLLNAPPGSLAAVRGIGKARQAQLLAVLELSRRALAEQLRDDPLLDSPRIVRDYLRLLIGARPYEAFICLFLDVRHRLIRVVETARGTLTHTMVYPREIVREALTLNAAHLIVAHNHPSGEVKPSASDRHLTQHLGETLQLVDVTLLDHLIVGSHAIFSFAECGLL